MLSELKCRVDLSSLVSMTEDMVPVAGNNERLPAPLREAPRSCQRFWCPVVFSSMMLDLDVSAQ